MPTPQEVLADPKFQALPEQERVKVLLRVDPNFGQLPPDQQLKVVGARAGAPALAQGAAPIPVPIAPTAPARGTWSGESYLDRKSVASGTSVDPAGGRLLTNE